MHRSSYRHVRPTAAGLAVALAVSLTGSCTGDRDVPAAGGGGRVVLGLITKTDTNPFFVTMKKGASAKAADLGAQLQSYAGTRDGDNDSQIAAIESLIAGGARGFLITPNDSRAIVPEIERARRAGLLVIALDTPTEPAGAVDVTFATDNFGAGELIGKWAAAQFRGRRARIATLDLSTTGVSIDVQRNQGFLSGFGIDSGDRDRIGDEVDPRLVGTGVTGGTTEGGRRAMADLLRRRPDINLVYTVNEPVAAGAFRALTAAGKEKEVTIVSIDGGCPGVADVAAGAIGATAMQFPLNMAALGVEAVVDFARTGRKPGTTRGLGFYNTGVELITARPVDGLDSKDPAWGARNCWG